MSIKFVATISGVSGPLGDNEQEAVDRLREYLESFIGKRHFHDANPESNDEQYQETLYSLYEKEAK